MVVACALPVKVTVMSPSVRPDVSLTVPLMVMFESAELRDATPSDGSGGCTASHAPNVRPETTNIAKIVEARFIRSMVVSMSFLLARPDSRAGVSIREGVARASTILRNKSLIFRACCGQSRNERSRVKSAWVRSPAEIRALHDIAFQQLRARPLRDDRAPLHYITVVRDTKRLPYILLDQ